MTVQITVDVEVLVYLLSALGLNDSVVAAAAVATVVLLSGQQELVGDTSVATEKTLIVAA